MASDVASYVMEVLGAEPVGSSDEYRADCISCGKPGHLYINIGSGLCHCFSCDYGANLLQIIQDVEGLKGKQARKRLQSIQQGRALTKGDRSLDPMFEVLFDFETQAVSPIRELPPGCVSITASAADPARHYLRGRGYRPAHYQHYGLLYVPAQDDRQPRYYKHIVFPEYGPDGSLVYWTTRAAYRPRPGIPKSYHPAGSKGGVLYGLARLFPHVDWLILVEGPMDVLAFPHCAVASLGSRLSRAQALTIKQTGKRVIVCYDQEATEAGVRAGRMLTDVGVAGVLVAKCPWSDPGAAAGKCTPGEAIWQVLGVAAKLDFLRILEAAL